MKVFLSWSGPVSHKAALLFREWLPSVLQNIDPYVSSEDIDKGARWSSDISQELQLSLHGIIFITRENIEAPWINFEAGALSKSLDKSRVTPLLIGIKRSDVRGPLLQFQSTLCDREDIKKLIFTLNRSSELTVVPEERLTNIFNVWWPQLESSLNTLQNEIVTNPISEKDAKSRDSDILEELIELVRSQQKILSDPSQLLPTEYIDMLMNNRRSETATGDIGLLTYRDLEISWEMLELSLLRIRQIPTTTEMGEAIEEVLKAARLLEQPISHIFRKIGRPRRKTTISTMKTSSEPPKDSDR